MAKVTRVLKEPFVVDWDETNRVLDQQKKDKQNLISFYERRGAEAKEKAMLALSQNFYDMAKSYIDQAEKWQKKVEFWSQNDVTFIRPV